MDDAETVRVTVEIVVEPDRIAGTVHEPDGRRVAFAGWLGLISALEGCRATAARLTR